jgi:hypothetical protein
MLSAAAVFAAAVSLLRLQLFWLLGAGAAFGVSSEYQLSTTWPPLPASLRRGLAWSCRVALAGAAAACGQREEDALRCSAERPVRNILDLTGLARIIHEE